MMSEYHLKSPRQAGAAGNAYRKVEDTAVSGYKAIEKKFVDTFLKKTDDDDWTSKALSSVEG